MYELSKLICLFVGNISKWIYYGGRKPMDEVLKEDNGLIGFVILALLFFFFYKKYV